MAEKKYVYSFKNKDAQKPKAKKFLAEKGQGLAEMTSVGNSYS